MTQLLHFDKLAGIVWFLIFVGDSIFIFHLFRVAGEIISNIINYGLVSVDPNYTINLTFIYPFLIVLILFLLIAAISTTI